MSSRSPDSSDGAVRPFSVSAADLDLRSTLVEVSGEFDMSVADQVDRPLAEAMGRSEQVLVGLRDCEFIDSTAIAKLVFARKEFEERGGRLVLCQPVDQVRHVLSVSGLMDPDFVFDSVGEALTSRAQTPAGALETPNCVPVARRPPVGAQNNFNVAVVT
jgi:anti-anti-sigma factor